MISKAAVKLSNPFLRTENKDSRKVAKCEISQSTNFSGNSLSCTLSKKL